MAKNPPKNKEKHIWIVLSLLFVIFAALLRFLMLDNKPIHFDESINMWFVRRIWEDGYFTYDPTNYHGPLYFYLIHFIQLFTGFDFLSTRWVASIFSFLTLILLWWGPEKERKALRWAAVFLLFSPAMSFYGRSGIHESSFVFFQVVGFLSFHYLVVRDFKKFWWYFAAGLFGMMALKETFVVLILAWIPAAVVCWYFNRRQYPLKTWGRDLALSFQREDVYVPVLFIFLIFVGVYSGFGAHFKGLADFFVALMPWLKTGVGGAGHQKEFLHWTKLMGSYEYATLAGFVLGVLCILKNPWIRFYFFFSLVLWFIYSWIPYKTPWCLISVMWPFAIVAGFGCDELFNRLRSWKKPAMGVVLAAVFAAEFGQMYKIVFQDPIDMGHPYVYVNSTYQMKEFISKVQGLIAEQPLLREHTIQIGAEESWPFPIVFIKFYNLNYQKYGIDVAKDALIYIVDTHDKIIFEEKLKENADKYANFLLETRQGRAKTLVYVKKEFFENRFSWPLLKVGEL
jgi:uncharacterized protein (TIGR03663 family)